MEYFSTVVLLILLKWVFLLSLFPYAAKAANKKAEKNKKSSPKTPNSIPEGEGPFSSVKEGEWRTHDTLTTPGKFMISQSNIPRNQSSRRCSGSISLPSQGQLGRETETKLCPRWQMFWRGNSFQKAYFPWEEKSGSQDDALRCENGATETLMSSLLMKHCVWFPWNTVYI